MSDKEEELFEEKKVEMEVKEDGPGIAPNPPTPEPQPELSLIHI